MPEPAEEAALGIHEEAILSFTDDNEGVTGAHEAGSSGFGSKLGVAIAVIAESLFKLGEIAVRVRQFRGRTRFVADRHGDQVCSRKGVCVLDGKVKYIEVAVVRVMPIAEESMQTVLLRGTS